MGEGVVPREPCDDKMGYQTFKGCQLASTRPGGGVEEGAQIVGKHAWSLTGSATITARIMSCWFATCRVVTGEYDVYWHMIARGELPDRDSIHEPGESHF